MARSWKKGESGNLKGRPKGARNKVTKEIREAFHDAFFERGGVKALLKWAAQNETDFYKLSSKLIPVQIDGEVQHTHTAQDCTDDELANIARRSSRGASVPTPGPQTIN